MRKFYLILAGLFLMALQIKAQAPNSLNYQGVARNSSGTVLTGQNISLRFTIHQGSAGGTTVYQETQSTTTNQLGLFTVAIGSGTVVSGTFSTIAWGVNTEYLQVEMDPTGGNSYLNMGTNQFLSVPYALNAGSSTGTAGGDLSGNYPNPLMAKIQGIGVSAASPSNNQLFGYNGANWVPTTPVLASSLFANQGTTTTVLHGNASGNPSWGAVNQATDVTGVLGYANGGTGLSTVGATGTVLTISGGVPAWVAPVTSATAWQLTGNSVTGTTNTLGTTNDFPLKLEINGAYAGTIDPQTGGNANTYIGAAAPSNGYGGAGNNDGGGYSVAIGLATLSSISGGNGYNVAVGNFALDIATAPSGSTAIGGLSQRYTTSSAGYNTTVGFESAYNNTVGRSITAVGANALLDNTASANVAVGDSALASNTSALQNTAVGYQALASSTSPYNTAVGFQALSGETSGSGYNTAVGGLALTAAASGNQNVAVGYQALKANTANANTAIGTDALIANASGTGNAAGGYAAAFGQGGSNNTAFGANALLGAASTGSGAITGTGGGNTAIGEGALQLNNSGTNNTALGFGATVSVDGLTNATAIGNGATVTASNTVVLGNNNVIALDFNGALAPYYSGAYQTGTSGQVLTSTGGGTPTWQTSAAPAGAPGSINYGTGTGSAFSASGSSGMVLVSGGGGAPTWQNVTAIGGTGDNWGSQVAANDSFETNGATNTINGNGTGSHPLTLAQQGATTGQVLSWNGSKWVPSVAATSGWGLTGNAVSTTSGTNFLGTTNAEPVEFKVNGAYAGVIDPGDANVYFGGAINGAYAGNFQSGVTANFSAGYNSVGIGAGALGALAPATTTPGQNYDEVAIGYGALLAFNPNNSTYSSSTAVGGLALRYASTGTPNDAFGYNSLGNLTTGTNNVAVGFDALDGGNNSATMSFNTGVGDNALSTLTTGTLNTAIGYKANVTSSALTNTTAIGANATTLVSNQIVLGASTVTEVGFNGALAPYYSGAYQTGTTGQVLTSNGASAPTWTTPGASAGWALTGNAVAYTASATPTNYLGTTASAGFQFGVAAANAGRIESSSSNLNTALGYQTLNTGAAGSRNTAVGCLALTAVTGIQNTAVGSHALIGCTGGNYNTAMGLNPAIAITTGQYNVAIGWDALTSAATSSSYNTALGGGALASAGGTAFSFATAVGYEALQNTVASNNTAVGYWSQNTSSSGTPNTSIGYESLYTNSTGADNVAVGYEALYANTAAQNTAVGDNALNTNTTGTINTAIGYNANVGANNLVNATAIGATAVAMRSYTLILGDSTDNINVGIGMGAPSTDAGLGIKGLHIETRNGSTAATVAAQAGAGTSATSAFGANGGTDVGGGISVTTGSGSYAVGAQVTVTFGKAYINAPTVVLTPTDATSALAMNGQEVYVTSTTTGFSINFGVAASSATTYNFNYFVIETK